MGGLMMTKDDVLSILLLALSMVLLSFVTTIPLKAPAFRVAAAAANDSDVVPILDRSGDQILAGDTTKYYIIPAGDSMAKYHGLTSSVQGNTTYVFTTVKWADFGKPMTFSFGDSQEELVSESQSLICIQFDSSNKWWVRNWNGTSRVRVSNDANQPGDLFTIKKVADQCPCYHICYNNDPLGIDNQGRVVVHKVNDTTTLLQVRFDKVPVQV